ncbi:MAG: RlmE family RNA methyltransferase [Syntrophobacterales bacterium]|jgi:23S rRNA (uridine2552-2'-O)-methyltransferase|nr:RlmE family RNA methyltransferase [Syntrophobacterales bacterium]
MSRFIVKDRFFNKAKQDGYRARSAYKILDIQKKFRLIRAGDCVLDLGSAPGSFLQVISKLVGDCGSVIGVDILPVVALPAKNITLLKIDIRDVNVEVLFREYSLDRFDAVTCDIAPNLSGIKEVDDKNVNELFEAVLNVVRVGLKTGGNFLIKSFFSDSLKLSHNTLKELFRKVSIFKPASSRSVSSEIFFVCIGKK